MKMNISNDMCKKMIRLAAILALFLALGQVAWAQAKVGGGVITAETQFYLKRLEVKNQDVTTRGSKVRLREANLFVVCKPEADVNAVKAQIKALGAYLKGTIGRTIMVSAPVGMVENMAAIEGIHYITKGPRVKQKTHVSREVTRVNKVLDGVAPLTQAYTGKGVIVGILDKGFDYTHPAFKDKDNNLRIKAVYMPGVHGDEPIVTADGENLDGLLITDPQQILDMGADCSGESHGIHCAAIAAGIPITFKDNVLGGMAPEADIVLCPFQQASPADDNTVGDNDADEEDKEVMNLFNGIRFVHDYAQREGKPYIISLSLNSHDGTHDGTSLISTTFDDLIQNGYYMVLATGNEGADSCYINRQFAENDTLHTILTQEAEVYAYSRQTSEIGCQIGLFNVETLKEEWRSPLLTNKNGNMQLNIDYEADEVEDMGFDGHPEIVEEIKKALGSATDEAVVKLSVGTQSDGHACVRFETQGSLEEPYVFTFHLTSPQGSIVDMWGDSGTTFANLIGSDYYTLGSSSISMGDWGTGGSIIFDGVDITKKKVPDANGKLVKLDIDRHRQKMGMVFQHFNLFPHINSYDETYIKTDEDNVPKYSSEVVGAVDGRYCWGSMSGTSMATPTVAGIIALWLEAKPDASYEEIKEAMAASAITDDFTKADPIRYGNGKIDAYRGLLHVLGISTRIPELSRHQPQDVTFRLSAGRLTFVGVPDGTPIRVYTTEGILLADSALQDGSISLPATVPGVYAVQVGNYGSILIRK